MRKINCVTIVSLSSGLMGEDFAKHQLALGIRRLEVYAQTQDGFVPLDGLRMEGDPGGEI